MKKKIKKGVSLFLAAAMSIGNLYMSPTNVFAAEKYEEIAEWKFDGNDTYGADWSKGGYTSAGVSVGFDKSNGYLKMDEDYTAATSTTYNRAMAMYSFGASSQADLSDAVKVSFDYYCTEGSEPSQFIFVFTGKIEGASSNTTVSENVQFGKAADLQSVSDIEGYNKYSVSYELSAVNAEQRGYITRMQIGEIRTNNTFKGTVGYDNIVFWKEADNRSKAVLDSSIAVYDKNINVEVTNFTGNLTYQWYKSSKADLSDAAVINGANSKSFKPEMKYIGGYIYCEASDGTNTIKSNAVRVAAGKAYVKTEIPFTTTAISGNTWFISNTKLYSGKFDASKMLSEGYFLVDYESGITGIPEFQFATWSSTTGKTTKQIKASATGNNDDGSKWAKYTYEDCIKAWGDEDFSELKAVRVYYNGTDKENLKVKSVSWNGYPLSYGELGESVELKGSYSSHQYLFTWHVGGTFDATGIKEDSFFYVEYKGDADAVRLVCQSHSNEDSTYVTIGASETGETGTGYYSIFTAKSIKEAFGEDFRYIDGMRIIKADNKNLSENASMYFFRGSGALVDDISEDGYDDAIKVPWTKYDNTDKTGIAVIGASISQNPLVTALSLSGAPYYAPNGGWNAILDRTDVVTYGIGSQTTVNIANRFDEVLKYNYDTIIIQCGNNDLGISSDESVVIAQEVSSYTTMYEKVKTKNTERAKEGKDPIQVYVIAINPTNSEGYGNTMQTRIENVVKALDELSAKYDFVTYIDEIHEEFKNKDENGNYVKGSPSNPDCDEVHVNPNLVMSDGLHPVAEGYAIYAKYLIPLLASKDDSDASLVSLSYRTSSDEKKNAVPGFNSGKLQGTEAFEVLLPLGSDEDSKVQIYIKAANLSSSVKVSGYEIKTDDYGNSYIEAKLVDGKALVTVEVTAPDGNKAEYKINAAIDDNTLIYESKGEKIINVTDGNVDGWPYVSFDVNYGGKIYTGSVLEFDVQIENYDFEKMYLEADFDWLSIKSMTLSDTDFDNGTYHVKAAYAGAELNGLSAIQIKTGGVENTDYRGSVKISNIKLDNKFPEAEPDYDDENLKETLIYTGNDSTDKSYTVIKSVMISNIDFDPEAITKGGYFAVEYTGEEGAVYLALSEWTDNIWASVYPVRTEKTATGYKSLFPYAALVAAYGSEDFSGVDAISAGSAATTGTTVLTKISWFGYPVEAELGETAMLYRGSADASKANSCLTFFYTKHVGGDWDASVINKGSYFYVEYTGKEDGIYIALTSASGATQWVAVYPDENGVNEGGRNYAIFKYDNFSKVFGTNFARLDQIQVYSKSDDKVVLKRVAYFTGNGAAVDGTDGTWDRPDSGIAFIGDSIVQNPLVDSVHLNNIDWNGILDRSDCVNYGIGGQTTKELTARIDEVAKKKYDKVVFLCGINDIGRGYTNEQIASNYKKMFEVLRDKNPDVELIVISVLPTTTAYYAGAQDRIVSLNDTLKTLVAEYENAKFVDCYSSFKGEDGYCKEQYVFDGLHPNLTGYSVIAEILNPYLGEEISSGDDSGNQSAPDNGNDSDKPLEDKKPNGDNSGSDGLDSINGTVNEGSGSVTDDGKTPETGDRGVAVLVLAAVFSLSAMVLLIAGKRNKRH